MPMRMTVVVVAVAMPVAVAVPVAMTVTMTSRLWLLQRFDVFGNDVQALRIDEVVA